MPIFPNFNYEYIVSAYRQLREKYFCQRYCIIAAVIFLICIIGILFFIIQNDDASTRQNIDEVPTQTSPPLPTEIDPNFLSQVDECFIPTAAVYGYTLRISSGFRTVAEQDQLYKQGRTVDGHIVTEAPGGKSIHNFGFAVDVVDRWREYDIDWEKLAKIGTYCGLEPSEEGDISHFENRDGLTTADFVAGRRPAALALPCAVMAERAKANQSLTLKDLQNCGASKF